MATHTSILAWKILVREGPGGLQSRGSQSWTRLSTHTHTHTPGSFRWCVHLLFKMDSSMKDSGRLVGHIMGWHLLPAFGLSRILLVSFQRQHHFAFQDLLLRGNLGKQA